MSATPNALPPETKVRPSPRVYARAFGEEMVLLDFGRGEYFGLDEIGAEVWRQIEAGETLNAIVARIVERYEVTQDAALEDIRALIEDMRARALVETF
jgi:hypothetical protein